MKYEYCCKCGCATGRAGAGEDSLYTEADGPFCEDCYPEKQAQQRTAAEGEDTRRAWVGLTDEEKHKLMWMFDQPSAIFKHYKYMEAIEAKLKEKNT